MFKTTEGFDSFFYHFRLEDNIYPVFSSAQKLAHLVSKDFPSTVVHILHMVLTSFMRTESVPGYGFSHLYFLVAFSSPNTPPVVPPALRGAGPEWRDHGPQRLHRKNVSVLARPRQEPLAVLFRLCSVVLASCRQCLGIPAVIVCVRNLCIWVCDKLCLEIRPGPRAFQAWTGKAFILSMQNLIGSLWNHGEPAGGRLLWR